MSICRSFRQGNATDDDDIERERERRRLNVSRFQFLAWPSFREQNIKRRMSSRKEKHDDNDEQNDERKNGRFSFFSFSRKNFLVLTTISAISVRIRFSCSENISSRFSPVLIDLFNANILYFFFMDRRNSSRQQREKSFPHQLVDSR